MVAEDGEQAHGVFQKVVDSIMNTELKGDEHYEDLNEFIGNNIEWFSTQLDSITKSQSAVDEIKQRNTKTSYKKCAVMSECDKLTHEVQVTTQLKETLAQQKQDLLKRITRAKSDVQNVKESRKNNASTRSYFQKLISLYETSFNFKISCLETKNCFELKFKDLPPTSDDCNVKLCITEDSYKLLESSPSLEEGILERCEYELNMEENCQGFLNFLREHFIKVLTNRGHQNIEET